MGLQCQGNPGMKLPLHIVQDQVGHPLAGEVNSPWSSAECRILFCHLPRSHPTRGGAVERVRRSSADLSEGFARSNRQTSTATNWPQQVKPSGVPFTPEATGVHLGPADCPPGARTPGAGRSAPSDERVSLLLAADDGAIDDEPRRAEFSPARAGDEPLPNQACYTVHPLGLAQILAAGSRFRAPFG